MFGCFSLGKDLGTWRARFGGFETLVFIGEGFSGFLLIFLVFLEARDLWGSVLCYYFKYI